MPLCNASDPFGKPYGWCKENAVYSDGSKHLCVFHAPKDKKGIPLEEFNKWAKSKMHNSSNFAGAIFPGDIELTNIDLGNNMELFEQIHFHGKVSFKNFTFYKYVSFRFAEFHDDVDFEGFTCMNKADFEGAIFHKNAKFDKANFKSADFYGPTFQGAVSFKAVDIGELLRFHNVKFHNAYFLRTDLRRCDFITCDWLEMHGRYILQDEYEINESVKSWSSPDKTANDVSKYHANLFYDIENLYRNLKHNSMKNHEQYASSCWHYSEKEMQRRKLSIKKTESKSARINWVILCLYNFLCGYGNNYQKAGRILIVLIFVLAPLALGITGIEKTLGDGHKVILSLSLKGDFSISRLGEIILTTLEHLTFSKAAEYKPHGQWGRFFMLLFKVFVPIQVALFGLSLRNRFRR